MAIVPLPEAVRRACAGGVTAVMLREKDLDTPHLVRVGAGLREVCRDAGVTFLVNHDVAAARDLGADGVHLGYRSVAVGDARAALGPRALVGCSTHDERELDAAIDAGADYVTFGPVLDTPSKRGLLEPRGWDALAGAVRHAAGLPVVALGGLRAHDAGAVRASGAAGTAAIRALLAVDDPERAARAFREGWERAAR